MYPFSVVVLQLLLLSPLPLTTLLSVEASNDGTGTGRVGGLSPEDRWLYYNKLRLETPHDDPVDAQALLESKSHERKDILLMDGYDESEGTVVINIDGRWGTVCDDNWSLKEATIVCKQLGFPYALQATTRDFFATNGMHPYIMDDVSCTGNETRLQDCSYWNEHDCSNREEAGVVCLNPNLKAELYNPRAPEIHGMSRNHLEAMREQKFGVTVGKQFGPNAGIVMISIQEPRSQEDADAVTVVGGVCPDRFFGPEANVACRSIGYPFASTYKKVLLKDPALTKKAPLLLIGHCFGNETDLNECTTFASSDGVLCKNQSIGIAVSCTDGLPDLFPDAKALEQSARVQTVPLFQVTCALEENCFPPVVYSLFSRQPRRVLGFQRRLLRFSSNIHNIGTRPFKPFLPPEKWVWHACHSHYHSMKVFSSYEIVDSKNRVLAVGHKASFCLEDSECAPGYKKKFVCSTSLSIRGDQGISPGCMDYYLHDYDCQWIDITDVPPGFYEFRAIFNPNLLVPEVSYANNAVQCSLAVDISGMGTKMWNCKVVHPLDF
nr:unnamed protein product [Spirometra erinaceieuropaei]